MPEQIELVSRVALVEQILPGLEAHILGAAAHKFAEWFLHPTEERMFSHDALEPFHGAIPQCDSLSRIARTSSVMSMPTGHQVMQRPQPTQPDVPN